MKPTIHHLRNALFSALSFCFILLLTNTTFASPASADQTDQTQIVLLVPGDTPATTNAEVSNDVLLVALGNLPANSISNVVNDVNRQTTGANNYTLANTAQNWQTADVRINSNGNYLKNVALYDVSQQIFYFTIANTNAGSGNQKQKSEGNTDGTPAVIFSSLSSLHAANSTGSSFSASALIPFALAAS